MKVFKFGGASVKDADGFRNFARILQRYANDSVMVILSALGKSTNALEEIQAAYIKRDNERLTMLFETLCQKHIELTEQLFDKKEQKKAVQADLEGFFQQMQQQFGQEPNANPAFLYDQIVSKGEQLSTVIAAHFLRAQGLKCQWIDVRNYIKTDNTYREGTVDWAETSKYIRQLQQETAAQTGIWITQGFLGGTPEGFTTTLGREGSDYSAAIFAHCLDAESLSIWKDVPGILNGDPRIVKDAQLIGELSYEEAIEMAFYGATVIHHKTVKPLQNKDIPLYVRSFINPDVEGTVIRSRVSAQQLPLIALKTNQILIDVYTKDFSFIDGAQLGKIVSLLSKYNITPHLSQNSAISYTTCVTHNHRIAELLDELSLYFDVRYQGPIEILTIRHFNDEVIAKQLGSRKVILQQKDDQTETLYMVIEGSSGIRK
ncbi:MAG: aspartate kinase [Sphingobacteriales bacterium]|nr:aspartate kinase [Sphingobacteriales bacterium]